MFLFRVLKVCYLIGGRVKADKTDLIYTLHFDMTNPVFNMFVEDLV